MRVEGAMQMQIAGCTLELVSGDITRQHTDAIVMLPIVAWLAVAVDSATSGARYYGGTRQKYPQGCPTGEAVITAAGSLQARFVIHAVGPIWRGGQEEEEQQLASAYHHSLQVAVQHHCQSVALPSLSTGAYGYPVGRAARTALHTVRSFLAAHHQPALVRFVLFDTAAYDSYAAALQEMMADT
jgi:O-acetyl-ADP-ribose deacetylase (regulator of RNase III)